MTQKLNKKDERIKKLIERGITDIKVIARKLGYAGGSMSVGIERVKEAMDRIYE